MISDTPLCEMAARQHGLVTRRQAEGLGFDRMHLRRRIALGEWEPLSDRVLRSCGSADVPAQRAMAAVLDSGADALLSHLSGAKWWGLPGFELSPLHTAVPRCADERKGRLATIHRVRSLGPHHGTVLDGVPVVRPELLALQLCGALHPGRAERALDRMWSQRLLSGPSTRRVLDEVAGSGVRGVTVLRALLDDRGPGYVPPGSHLEARFEQVLRDGGREPMVRQVDVGDEENWCGRVDFADSPRVGGRAMVEVDSERFHAALVDVRADARRQARLERAGFIVGRVTDVQVFHRPREVLAEVDRVRRQARLLGGFAQRPA